MGEPIATELENKRRWGGVRCFAEVTVCRTGNEREPVWMGDALLSKFICI